jgi:nucleotidyltransferase/DNA polymerase involved in DNA repair
MTQVLNQFGAVVERASIDEAYLDLSAVVDRRQGTAFRICK